MSVSDMMVDEIIMMVALFEIEISSFGANEAT